MESQAFENKDIRKAPGLLHGGPNNSITSNKKLRIAVEAEMPELDYKDLLQQTKQT